MRAILILAAFLGVICLPAGAQEEGVRWFSFEPEIVALEGILELKPFAGPSTFGEIEGADRIEIALIVRLSAPISVRRSDNDPLNGEDIENVTQIQLNCADHLTDCVRLANKKVRVTGTLFAAHTGHHHARLLIDVGELSEIK